MGLGQSFDKIKIAPIKDAKTMRARAGGPKREHMFQTNCKRGRVYGYGKRWKRDVAKPLCSENIDGLQPHT